MIKEKLRSILTKIKNNKKKVIGITALVFVLFGFTFLIYNFPFHKKLHANISEITNNTFKDDLFYSCIITAYNNDNNASKTTQDNLTDAELSNITNLDCHSSEYYDTSGIEKLTGLEELQLSGADLHSIDLSKNEKLKSISFESVDGISSLDLSNNTLLTRLHLRDCHNLFKLILNEKVNLDYINLDNSSLFDSVSLQVGQVYNLKSNIVGPKLTYNLHSNSSNYIKLEEDTVTALSEGSEILDIFLNDKFIGYQSIYIDKKVELETYHPEHITINNSEKYVYVKDGTKFLKHQLILQNGNYDISSSIGHLEINDTGNILKIISYDDVIDQYKLVYVDTGIKDIDNTVIISSVNEPDKSNIRCVNCDYEFSDDKKELIVKYNGEEIDRKTVIRLFVPFAYKVNKAYGDEIFIFSKDMPEIKRISNINEINENMINILDYNMTLYNVYDERIIRIANDSNISLFEIYYYNVYSETYDLSKDYIYLGSNEFNNDIKSSEDYYEFNEFNDSVVSYENGEKVLEWKLVKITSDKYDMSSDAINLGNEDIDLSGIKVTNATLKVDNNKLLVMYGDEVVKEFKSESVKKITTTKKDDEKTTTTNTTTKTNKKEIKTTTTKKKVNIIDKIFGNNETTTTKKEETTIKKNIFRKSTTIKVESNRSNATSNNKNSFKKLVTGNNLLILFLSITGIALIIYIIINKKKDKET